MSQPTLTIWATTRCATKPGESLITETGTPSNASIAWAAARTSLRVAGLTISVRRLAKPNRGSTPTVRAGSRPSSSAVVVTSLPSGATKQISASLLPLPEIRCCSSGTAQADLGVPVGTDGSGIFSAAPAPPYVYQPRRVLRPSSPAATRGWERNEGRYFGSSKYCWYIDFITECATSRPTRSI